MGFENNVYGAVHPENSENMENEERDRHNQEKKIREQAPKGRQPFVPVEELPDNEAETAIYENANNSVEGNKEEIELDKFGFVSVLEDYFNEVADDKKEELFKNINEFLVEYRTILDNEKDEKSAIKAASKAFKRIIGTPITGYDAKTGKIFFEVNRAKYIQVKDKKAPANAIKAKYNKYGKPVDPNQDPVEKNMRDGRKKTKPARPGVKMPWRRHK